MKPRKLSLPNKACSDPPKTATLKGMRITVLSAILVLHNISLADWDSWADRWRVSEPQFIQAIYKYKAAKTRDEKVQPAVMLFRAEKTLLKSQPQILQRMSEDQKEILEKARRTFFWAKGASDQFIKKMDFFNVHFTTKTNDLSVHRINENFEVVPSTRSCDRREFEKLSKKYHPEFLIEHGRNIKTLLYDYEFLEQPKYYENFKKVIGSRSKFFKVKYKNVTLDFMQAMLVEPVNDNGERIKRRLDQMSGELKKIAKGPHHFVFQIYQEFPNCLRAYPETAYYEFLRAHQTDYYGNKLLALAQLYVDKRKQLPLEGNIWQELFDFYQKKSARLRDEKEPSQVFMEIIRDGWGQRFKIIKDKNKFWIYSEVKQDEKKVTQRFGPGFLK